MNIGNLKQSLDEKTRQKSFLGDVRLIGTLNGKLALTPHPAFVAGKSANDHPQFIVEYQPRSDMVWYEVGAAWIKPMKAGGEYISVTLDMPHWDKPLNLALFAPNKERNETDWRLQWSRPRGGEQEQAAA